MAVSTTHGSYIESDTYISSTERQVVHCTQTEVWDSFADCRSDPSACGVVYPTTETGEYNFSGGGGGYVGGVSVPIPFTFKVSDCNYDMWYRNNTMTRDSLMTCQRGFNQYELDELDSAETKFWADTANPQYFDNAQSKADCATMKSYLQTAKTPNNASFGVGNTNSVDHGGQSMVTQSGIPQGVGHIDPMRFHDILLAQNSWYKDQARRVALRSTVHEALHAFGNESHADQTTYPNYQERYFKQLNYFGVMNSCIR
jgi:hypothetical protein